MEDEYIAGRLVTAAHRITPSSRCARVNVAARVVRRPRPKIPVVCREAISLEYRACLCDLASRRPFGCGFRLSHPCRFSCGYFSMERSR